MNTITKHENVFVRSMSTRGSTGGLNPAVYDTFMLLSAAGFDMIVIETVGVGQTEIDIISFADTTAVVSVPEAGDEIQIFKSDLLELGDVFVLNKADLPGAERMELIIKQLFNLKNTRKSSDNKIQTFSQADWQPELIKTSTVNNQGLDELKEKIDQHREYLKHNGILKEKFRQSIEKQLLYKMEEKIYKKLIKKIKKEGNYKEQLGAIISGKLTPNQAAEKLLENKINI